MSPWIIAILALLAFHFLFIILGRKHFEKLNLSLMAPFVLWHTKRGLSFLDRASEHRNFWDVFHPVALALCYIAMLGMIVLLLVDVYTFVQVPEAVGGMDPRMILAFPGINPIIPIGYGILALIITLVFHELSHGIVSRHQGITVKTMGLLFFIIPLGAFVEPDDKEIEASEPSKRLRIEEAGAGMNMVIGIIALLLVALLAGSMVPRAAGVVVADSIGPAAEAGIMSGDIITAINGIEIKDLSILENFAPGDTIMVTLFRDGALKDVYVELADLSEITGADPGKAGIGVSYLPFDLAFLSSVFANPFSIDNFLVFLVAPLQGLIPFNEPLLSFYSVPFNPQVFSMVTNVIYWISWFNLLVGSFNVLPVSILDGYAIFRDSLLVLGEKLKISKERREKLANTTARSFSWFFGLLLIFIILVSII
ncbi:MAG: site-2 protease family protein [Candidatus Thermoplasmatota archaeon]|nr:site-2 protease family protein [Candidatus Thermoplasmatota archaeon]